MPKGGNRGSRTAPDKSFSQKQKKKQLQEKREKKRGAATARHGPDSDDDVASAAVGGDYKAHMTTSLGKSGNVNQFSTVFVKESADAVAERKKTSMDPIDTSRRAKGLFAVVPNR